MKPPLCIIDFGSPVPGGKSLTTKGTTSTKGVGLFDGRFSLVTSPASPAPASGAGVRPVQVSCPLWLKMVFPLKTVDPSFYNPGVYFLSHSAMAARIAALISGSGTSSMPL